MCKCVICGKEPSQLMEYKILAEENGYDSPEQAMMNEEGTYDMVSQMFCCTSCYIKIGQPLGKARESWRLLK